MLRPQFETKSEGASPGVSQRARRLASTHRAVTSLSSTRETKLSIQPRHARSVDKPSSERESNRQNTSCPSSRPRAPRFARKNRLPKPRQTILIGQDSRVQWRVTQSRKPEAIEHVEIE